MPINPSITDFLIPINLSRFSHDEGYKDGQVGKLIAAYEEELPDLSQADLVFVGCAEERGARLDKKNYNAPDRIREQLYQLFYWHTDVKLADIGNIQPGASLGDTYAALRSVIAELTENGKTVVILGGSHDLTLGAILYLCRPEKINRSVLRGCADRSQYRFDASK